MRVSLDLAGKIAVDRREVAVPSARALLAGIAAERSVQGVARRLGISYRSAWGRVRDLEAVFAHPLVLKTKGHGTVLTPFGVRLHRTLEATAGMLEPVLTAEAERLEAQLATLLGGAPAAARLAISHDPLLIDVLAAWPDLSVSVVGSTEAVERLRAGRAEAAGFHGGEAVAGADAPQAALLADPTLVTQALFAREQGLILAPGNPLRIRTVADLAATGARYVNRQRGSGTRLWFDRLLGEAGLAPAAIRGYGTEEFTHRAVAAVIASGAADAGMGARAEAERFGLAFAPIGVETYFLAARAELAATLIAPIAAGVRAALGRMPGYAPPTDLPS